MSLVETQNSTGSAIQVYMLRVCSRDIHGQVNTPVMQIASENTTSSLGKSPQHTAETECRFHTRVRRRELYFIRLGKVADFGDGQT